MRSMVASLCWRINRVDDVSVPSAGLLVRSPLIAALAILATYVRPSRLMSSHSGARSHGELVQRAKAHCDGVSALEGGTHAQQRSTYGSDWKLLSRASPDGWRTPERAQHCTGVGRCVPTICTLFGVGRCH